MMNTKTDAYIYWIDNKKCLEEILNRREALTQPEQLTADNLIQVQSGLRGLQEEMVHLQKTCGGDLPPSSYREIKDANKAFDDIVETLSQKRKEYLSLAPQIYSEIKQWCNSKDNDKEKKLISVMELCSKYRCAADFDPEFFPEKTQLNQFYTDLSELTFIASPLVAEGYLQRYTQLTTVDEVVKFKQGFEYNFWQKADETKDKLKQKHERRISKEEQVILNVHPLGTFTQIRDDIQNITKNPTEFQKTKKELWRGIMEIRDDLVYLANNKPVLNQTYVSKVLATADPIQLTTDYLLLKKDSADYHKSSGDLKKLKEEKKKELTKLAKTECSELTNTITAALNSHDYAHFERYTNRITELKDYCKRLGEEETSALLHTQFDRIDRINKYVAATQPKEKRELKITVGEYETKPQLTDKMVDIEPKKVTANKDLPWMPIVTEQDLTVAGFRYSRYARDDTLKQLCLQIAGMNEKGEYLCSTLRERAGRIDKRWAGEVGEKLIDDDTMIYFALKEGMGKCGYAVKAA